MSKLKKLSQKNTNMNWFDEQLSWLKSFFDNDDIHTLDASGHNPDSKNLLGIALVIIFAVAFLKKVATSPDMPDIPGGWQIVILGILGIRALQSGTTAYLKNKEDKEKTE